jgi:hypothetical protein
MLFFALGSTEGKRSWGNAEEHDGRKEEKIGCVAVPTVNECMAVRNISALQSLVFHVRAHRSAYTGLRRIIGC